MKPNKLRGWFILFFATGSSQLLAQFIGFCSGIIIIRYLSIEEYAIYTLANSMLGVAAVLSDGGIANGVMAEAGKVWQDKDKLGKVVATSLRLRKILSTAVLTITLPVMYLLFVYKEVTPYISLLMVLSLIPALYAQLSESILQIVPKLHQDIKPLQINQIVVNIVRLILSATVVLILPWSYIAVLVNGLSVAYGNFRLKKISSKYVNRHSEDVAIRRKLVAIVKRVFPASAYYAFSSQLTIWLMTIFGSTVSIAQLGALSRLNVAFHILLLLINTLLVPRYSRSNMGKVTLLPRYTSIMVFSAFLVVISSIFLWVISEWIFMILGPDYSELNYELMLQLSSVGITALSTTSNTLNMSKGWVINPIIPITFNIFSIIIGCLVFDVSTLNGALYVAIFAAIIAMSTNVVFGYVSIIKLKYPKLE